MLDRKKNIIAEWLVSEGYAEVEPMDFYREVFPQGLIDKSTESKTINKGAGKVQLLVESKTGIGNKKGYGENFYDDLSVLETVISSTASTKEIWAVPHFLSTRQMEVTFMISTIKISE